MNDVYSEIVRAVLKTLDGIGSQLDADAAQETLKQGIYDKGDFFNSMEYSIFPQSDSFVLQVGSNTPHEPFVLGGKKPSWTPLEPLKGWIERKNLNWTDKKTGKELSVEQIAYLIRGKIRREGIPARNVFKTVIENRKEWIINELENLEVIL